MPCEDEGRQSAGKDDAGHDLTVVEIGRPASDTNDYAEHEYFVDRVERFKISLPALERLTVVYADVDGSSPVRRPLRGGAL